MASDSACWYIGWYQRHTNAADTNMPLSDLEIRAAKPGDRLFKLSDGGASNCGSHQTARSVGAWHTGSRAGKNCLPSESIPPGLREAREEAKKLPAAG